MSATDLNRKAHIIKWRVILLQFCPFWASKEDDLMHCNSTYKHLILYERDQIFTICVSSLWVNFPGYVMFDINYTKRLNFCVVPYIYNEYMSSTVSIIAIIVDTMRLLHVT